MEIADDIFPMDFYIYEIGWPGDGIYMVKIDGAAVGTSGSVNIIVSY